MICYRDMTFCSFGECRDWDTCPRALTDDVEGRADDAHLPICQFADKPDCFKEADDEPKEG